MKVFILDNGYLECDSNHMVAMNTCATVNEKAPVHQWIKIPVYAVLIDHPHAKILYDTGCPPTAMEGKWPLNLTTLFPYTFTPEQRLESQLQKVGYQPKDIDIVVMSHMHLDHAGNLDLFTHADVYVHRDDFCYGLMLTHQNPDPATHGAYVRADLEVPCKFKMVDDDFELVPGVEVINLPGHTPGVLGIMVHLQNSGTLIFPMDALYQRGNYGPPPRMSGIIYDSISFFKSIEKIRKLAQKNNAQIMFSHDMEFFKTMRLAPFYYD
ncbi:N-acyl homoserine lactonase family protein [Desulfofundulus thermocisternus]|uniref:N-acyl homoserine lactonase family protein n=1 Tax=Desulfofundulus thermocisternus TaxID=42471 RepID=UPI00217DFEB4|nr:N-acyl homoserine lactonase family protein [Desulfofundulus thermocisternus]MCS5695923.1 N-acyl homoserine lactonase family protein [Desulfofundulus thermocisternus]